MLDQRPHQGWRYRLPSTRSTLLSQQHQALVRIHVPRTDTKCSPTSACSFGVEAQQETVQMWIVATCCHRVVDHRKFCIGQCTPQTRKPARLRDVACRVLIASDEPILLGVPVQAAGCGDEVLRRTASATRVPANLGTRLHLLGKFLELGWRWVGQSTTRPRLLQKRPVRLVCPPRTWRHRSVNSGDVVRERGNRRGCRLLEKLAWRDTETVQHELGGSDCR